jgi:DNA-binding MarR family transcriptional regulator
MSAPLSKPVQRGKRPSPDAVRRDSATSLAGRQKAASGEAAQSPSPGAAARRPARRPSVARRPPRHSRRRFDSAEQQAYLSLWRAYDRLKAIEDEVFGPHEISAQQYNALRLLKSVAPDAMPTLALAARLISRAPDITRLIDKLERRGLAERRRRAGNRRVVDVAITAAGEALLKALAAPVREGHFRQLGHLSASQLGELVALLDTARRPHEDPKGPWS